MQAALSVILLLVFCCTVLPVSLYLLVLTLVAPFGLRRPSQRAMRLRRFAVLIPAHDEQSVLGRLLLSLRQLDYPSALYDVCVVADNCTDATAAIGRAGGALVFERSDTERRAKGYALSWLLEQLAAQHRSYDAFVVVDADSVVSGNFLTAMNGRLDAGALVVQAYCAVLKLTNAATESLREIALALVHFLRPAAKMAMGASCGLKGNGMCFDRSVIERFGWPAVGLAEDVEFHLALVGAGVRVVFAPEATVRSEMPSSLAGSTSQNLRWEAGRLAAVRRQVLPLLVDGLRRRSITRVDAALEQLTPPLSVPVLLATLLLVAGLALQSFAIWVGAAAALIVVGLHVTCGLILGRIPRHDWFALVTLPRYILWKGLLYLRAMVTPQAHAWIRTPHGQQEGSRPPDGGAR